MGTSCTQCFAQKQSEEDQRDLREKYGNNQSIMSTSQTNDTPNSKKMILNGDGEEMKNQFQSIKIIGRGAFGLVYLVVHKPTGTQYAMKVLKKEKIQKLNQG